MLTGIFPYIEYLILMFSGRPQDDRERRGVPDEKDAANAEAEGTMYL